MSTAAHIVWDLTYENGTVPANQVIENVGTVRKTIHVSPGGWLTHRGYAGEIEVAAGGHLVMHGMVGHVNAAQGSDVVFVVEGREIPMSRGYPQQIPFTGPEGWGQLDQVWESCVRETEQVIEEAHLEQAATEQMGPDPSTSLPYTIAMDVMATTDMSDLRMWALLSAAAFNPADDLRVLEGDIAAWSPEECRQRLRASGAQRRLTEAPWLLRNVANMPPPEAGRLALALYDAIWPLVSGLVAIGEPPGASTQAALSSVRTVLNDEVLRANAKGSEQPTADGPTTRSHRRPTPPETPTESAAEVSLEATVPVDAEERPVQSALAQLEKLIGLENVKTEIQKLGARACLFRERERRHLLFPEPVRHTVMTGNPGTGKATVARLLGQIYHGYGLLPRRGICKVHRTELVANAARDTEEKTRRVFMGALGGVLFIDEADMLTPRGGRDFGKEAVDELNRLMEDHCTQIMLVVAGDPEKMGEFLDANQRLAGRFGPPMHFPDYTNDQLHDILLNAFVWANDYELSDEAEDACRVLITQARGMMGSRFDNAWMVRRLFERATVNQSARLHAKAGGESRVRELDDEELVEIVEEDLPTAAVIAQRPEEDA